VNEARRWERMGEWGGFKTEGQPAIFIRQLDP